MIRFCGQFGLARKRGDRIIRRAMGKMDEIRTPGVLLENVIAPGEFFTQRGYKFWPAIGLGHPGQYCANVAASDQ